MIPVNHMPLKESWYNNLIFVTDKIFSYSSPMKKLGMVQVIFVHIQGFERLLICLLSFFKLVIRERMTAISLLFFGITIPIRTHFICDESFHLCCFIIAIKITECISHDIVFTFD